MFCVDGVSDKTLEKVQCIFSSITFVKGILVNGEQILGKGVIYWDDSK